MHLLQVSDQALRLLLVVFNRIDVRGDGIEAAAEIKGQVRVALAVAGLVPAQRQLPDGSVETLLVPASKVQAAPQNKPEEPAAAPSETPSQAGEPPAPLPVREKVKRARKR